MPEAGAIYVMDRGFVDFGRLHRLAQAAAFFVVRSKTSVKWRRIESRSVDKPIGIEADQIIRLAAPKSRARYPDRLRRVSYRDPDTGKSLVFLTNNLTLPARTIADLYQLIDRAQEVAHALGSLFSEPCQPDLPCASLDQHDAV